MLHFLEALLRARATVPPLEDCPEGAPLMLAWRLEATSTDDSSPAAASSPRISTWVASVSSPTAGGDDSRSAHRGSGAPRPRPSSLPPPPAPPHPRPTGRTVGGSRA